MRSYRDYRVTTVVEGLEAIHFLCDDLFLALVTNNKLPFFFRAQKFEFLESAFVISCGAAFWLRRIRSS
jgi:hypothetical protein